MPQNRANEDLTTQKAEQFKRGNKLPMVLEPLGQPQPIKVSYFSISADANADDSPGTFWNWLNAQEADGLPVDARRANLVYQMMGEVRMVKTGKILLNNAGKLVEVEAAEEVPTSSFQLNDVAVPVWSGQGDWPFIHVNTVKKNHASIASPDVAAQAGGLVRRAQSLKFQ